MICLKTQYFNLHRILLLTIGLWPDQQSRLAQFQFILFFSILVSLVVLQFVSILTEEITFDLVINTLSIELIFIMYVIVYDNCRRNLIKIVERPLKELQEIYNELKDKEEIAIMTKYGDSMKHISFFVILLSICSVIVISPIILLPILLHIFGNVALHISESKVRDMFTPNIYFTDQNIYLYVMVLHYEASFFIGEIVIVATGLILIAYLKYTCGMFKIASYRIKKAMSMQNVCPKNEIIMYEGIIHAIDIHRTAIKFLTFSFTYMESSLFSLITIAVICLSLNLYAISKNMLHEKNIDEFFIHSIIIIGIFVFLFLLNYYGEEFTGYNNEIFFTVYNVQWYVASLRIQKLILFLLQRGNKTVNLNLGGMFILSLELLGMLTKVSISYFTVLYSIQE